MITNLLPAEATHTTLDLFEKQPLLFNFDNVFTQKVELSYSMDGPMLEFEGLGDRNNFKDLQKILLAINCISRNNDGDLRKGCDAANTNAPYLSNKALHSFFSDCTVSANGVKIPNTNGTMRTKHSLKRSFLQEKLQKTYG